MKTADTSFKSESLPELRTKAKLLSSITCLSEMCEGCMKKRAMATLVFISIGYF